MAYLSMHQLKDFKFQFTAHIKRNQMNCEPLISIFLEMLFTTISLEHQEADRLQNQILLIGYLLNLTMVIIELTFLNNT